MKAVLLLPNNEYGKGLADEFDKAFTDRGGKTTFEEFYDASGPSDFRTNITKIKSYLSEADFLVTVNVANTVEPLFQQLATIGWNKPIISDYNTVQNPSLKDKKLVEGVTFVDWTYTPEPSLSDSEVTKTFKQRYVADYNKNPTVAAAGYYDGVKVLLDALKTVGSDPQKVSNYIQGLKDYSVVTGTIKSFDSDCQAIRSNTMRQVKDGQVVDVQ
jgi:branched-chain amino acid transport system substrate-binding protein